MDFESLGEDIIIDSLENNDLYLEVKDGEEIKHPGKSDLEKAKGFLSSVHPRLNISLYDHLADVIKTILRTKVSDAVDKFEQLSLQVKNLRQKPDSDLTEVFEIGEELQKYIQEKQIFYKFKTLAVADPTESIKTADDDENDSDQENDEETAQEVESKESAINGSEPDLDEALPDLGHTMSRFSEAGIGLSPEDVFELSLALKDLAIKFKLRKVRFWGKVLAMSNDYFVAEAPYQEGIEQEKYGLEESKVDEEDQPGEEEEEDKKVEEEEDEEGDLADEEQEEMEDSEKMKIPPVPEARAKVKPRIPPEANGIGVNKYLFFVCTKIGQPWRVLPFMLPTHISEARYLKRFFTGDLDSQIRGCVPYPGKEAHYLRAQIARITASTYIAPSEYYKMAGETDEDDNGDDETDGNEENEKEEIVPNKLFVPKATKYVHSEGLDSWCHYRKAILEQGRSIPMKLEDKEDNDGDNGEDDEEKAEEEEDEDPEILEAIIETEVPMLRSIKEDKGIGGLKPWSVKLSSKLIEEKAVLIIYSNIWPGAYTFYDGKTFDHIYIGYGFKYNVFHYAPPVRVAWHKEYEGDDVTEHVDTPKEDIEEGEAENEKLDEEEPDLEDEED